MNDNNPPANWPDRAVGFGAGLASALLFVVSTRGSSLAMILAYFSPLPLMIGAAGFSFPAGILGALVGAGLLAVAALPPFAVGYLFGFALPAALLAGMIQTALPSRDKTAPAPRFATPGEMLEAVIVLTIVVTGLGVTFLVVHYHGFEPALDAIVKHFAPALDQIAADLGPVAPDVDAEAIKRLTVMSAPAGVAASQTLLLAVNLWLAARTIEISGRLRRPWPALPENLALPRFIAPIFLIAAGVTFSGGLPAVVGGIVAAASGFGLALQGLAALHGLSRNAGFRGAWLAALYAAVIVLEPWSIIILALFGLVESVFSLRARKARRNKPEN
ncbi:DUF2232 domain-containing protein [Rhodoblastus sp.]|uniref:DUF2232 domain-containing protein n=1 Tax=Rhodoblastus sp. TaxID=1962975 RepID=UPI002614E37E|nr:DUF2232 domain-containing protein [Rhodoblastus sp.]